MFYKVKNIKALKGKKLFVEFENGVSKIYNVKDLIFKYKNFEALNDDTLFNLVKVDVKGYGIYWNDYLDIECNELWYNGQETDIVAH